MHQEEGITVASSPQAAYAKPIKVQRNSNFQSAGTKEGFNAKINDQNSNPMGTKRSRVPPITLQQSFASMEAKHMKKACCCLSAEAVRFLHLFLSVRADYNHNFRLDWLHSSSSLSRRLSRHLHLQQQIHQHSQHQYISAANQEIKAGDKFFRTSDLQQQSMMMGCCLSAEAVLFLHLCFSVKADYNHSFRLDWLHSSSSSEQAAF
nr:hypothetical protein Iba_chr12cCG7500 [Ipomoea batatas]